MPIYRPKYYEHGVYHIYNRGVAKLPTFLHDDDYHDFQDILRYLAIGFPLQKDANLLSCIAKAARFWNKGLDLGDFGWFIFKSKKNFVDVVSEIIVHENIGYVNVLVFC